MRTNVLMKASGKLIVKGVEINDKNVTVLDIFENIDDIDSSLINNIKSGKTLVAFQDNNIFADTTLEQLLEQDSETLFSNSQSESQEPIRVYDEPFTESELDTRLVFGLFNNKANGL